MNKKPDLNLAWRRTFWALYDNLGLSITLSLLWLFLSCTVILAPSATASLYCIYNSLIRGHRVHIKDFFLIMLRNFIKSTLLSAAYLIAIMFIVFNIRFYASHFGILGIFLAGISFWIFIMLFLTGYYIFPLFCLGKKTKEIIKFSLLLALNNIKFTVISALLLSSLSILVVLLPVIGISLLIIFHLECFIGLQAYYDKDIAISVPNRNFRELIHPWLS